jgi:tRNA(Ile)-lysidine synthase TilS/MesJ
MRIEPIVSLVVGQVERLLRRYPGVDIGEVTVAFSGGKDSLALAHALREIGKNVRLKSIDMGYSAEWSARIQAIASALGFDLEIILVADLLATNRLRNGAKNDLAVRRRFLQDLEASPNSNITPCTNCYNCKIIALTQLAPGGDGEIIYFGHHSDDMLASFLKSALMYYDRWELRNEKFVKANFIALVREFKADLGRENSLFVRLFLRYLQEGKASTEEPIYERKVLHEAAYAIARPLAFISEEDTKTYSKLLGVSVEGSGCGHTATLETRTPREVIQYDLFPALVSDPIAGENLKLLKESIFQNLNPDGTLRFDTRLEREKMLGRNYKGGQKDLQQKY